MRRRSQAEERLRRLSPLRDVLPLCNAVAGDTRLSEVLSAIADACRDISQTVSQFAIRDLGGVLPPAELSAHSERGILSTLSGILAEVSPMHASASVSTQHYCEHNRCAAASSTGCAAACSIQRFHRRPVTED
jgi:hypothetical protein